MSVRHRVRGLGKSRYAQAVAAYELVCSGWPTPSHATRREGDEMACRCGKRWPVGEDHP